MGSALSRSQPEKRNGKKVSSAITQWSLRAARCPTLHCLGYVAAPAALPPMPDRFPASLPLWLKRFAPVRQDREKWEEYRAFILLRREPPPDL